MHEAAFYRNIPPDRTQCVCCRHGCLLKPGQRGLCAVRENRDGTLYSLVYGKVAARGVDPVEKKPLFHFLPGSLSYSIAAMGCNFRCAHCQNCTLSQTPALGGEIRGETMTAEGIVKSALSHRCRSISYTYSEPTVFAEMVLDTARAAKEKGLFNLLVTNGYATPELIKAFSGLIDGANIDLKAFSEKFYRDVCGARLEGVLDTVRRMHGAGIHLEITTLLIPGLNDGEEEVAALAAFIAGVDPKIPWHISRYHPAYRMTDRPVTPVESLRRAQEIGRQAGLDYVYTGNVPGDKGENTYCPGCGGELIRRRGFMLEEMRLTDGKCPTCGTLIFGLFDP